MSELPPLTVNDLMASAAEYARLLTRTPIPELFGITDGKAVGTHVEAAFNVYVGTNFSHTPGNAAKGIDFPELDVDLKVTSIRQPQSSSPFRDATQKVYGLDYHLLVFVYEKADDAQIQAARLSIRHVMFIHQDLTADYQTTSGLHHILDAEGNVDDVDAFLEERNLPLEEVGRRALAKRILVERPRLGCLTMSNALQWRLQYGRAIQLAAGDSPLWGLEDLLAQQ